MRTGFFTGTGSEVSHPNSRHLLLAPLQRLGPDNAPASTPHEALDPTASPYLDKTPLLRIPIWVSRLRGLIYVSARPGPPYPLQTAANCGLRPVVCRTCKGRGGGIPWYHWDRVTLLMGQASGTGFGAAAGPGPR